MVGPRRGWLLVYAMVLFGVALAPGRARAQPVPAVPAPPVPPARTLLQTPQFRDYGRREGMTDAGSYMAVQDPRGFIWVGTRDGLVRYDGVHFEVFRHDTSNPHSLPGNDISALLIDARGGLWAGGEGTGLLHYIPGYGFQRWVHKPGDAHSLGADDVFALAQTPDGAIWVGTYAGGLTRLGPHGHITQVRHRKGDAGSLVSDVVFSLHATADGDLWIGTLGGLDVRASDGRIEHVRFPQDQHAVVLSVAGSGASLRAVTTRGLYLIQRDQADPSAAPRALPVPGGAGVCYSSVTDAAGGLWLACSNGLRYRDAAGRWSLFLPQPQLRGGLPSGRIVGLLRDREGGLWLTSNSGGLAYLPPDWRDFSLFRHVPDDPSSLPFGSFTALCAGAGHSVLLGNAQGWIGRLDPGTGAVQSIAAPWTRPHEIDALTEDPQGRLWVGGPGPLYLRDAAGRWRTLALPWPDTPGSSIAALAVAGDNTLYFADPIHGLGRIDLRTLAVSRVALPRPDLAEEQTTALRWHDGQLWRATRAGLERMDTDGALRAVPGVQPGVVDALAFDARGFWLARTGALEHYRLDSDGRARLLARIDARQGWPGARVLALAVDAAGRVWASTLRGLMRYDPHDRRVNRFEEEPVLAGLRASAAGFVRGADGSLFTAVRDGLLGFAPLRRAPGLPAPRPVLTRMQASGDGRSLALSARDGTLRLGWRTRDLTITMRALSYLSPARVRYRVRLPPWNRDWVEVGGDGVQNFGRLEPGSYRLEVQAQAMSGGPWGAAAPLRVTVVAPPWATWWARLGYVLLAAALLVLVVLLWRRRMAQRQRMLLAEERRRVAEQASAAKTSFLAELGHEIRTPMTGVLGMCELLSGTALDARQQRYVQAIARSGGLLQKLVNDALDLARIEAGRMQLDEAPYDPVLLVFELAEAERPLAAAKGLSFGMEMQPAELPHHVLGDELRIRQILFNLLGNALKFTASGGVSLGLTQQQDRLCFSVADSGPGIDAGLRARLFRRYEQADGPQRSAGSGLGLAISRELAELMGGTLDVESQPGRGSRFTLCLPLRRAPAPPPAAARAEAGRGLAPLQLALVEDDTTVVAVLQGLLEAQGHQVRHAADGLAALALLADWRPDALLLDLDLPGVDGFTVARMLRAREAPGARLPILAISARSGGDEAQRVAAAGMDGFLRKPVSGAGLAGALAELMQHARQRAVAPAEPACTEAAGGER